MDSSCRYLTPHCVHCSLIIQYDRPFTDAIVTYALPFLSFSIQSVVPLGLMVGLISCAHVSHLYVGLSLSSHLPLSVLRPVVHTYVTSLLIRSSFTQYPRGLLLHMVHLPRLGVYCTQAGPSPPNPSILFDDLSAVSTLFASSNGDILSPPQQFACASLTLLFFNHLLQVQLGRPFSCTTCWL